MVPASNLNKILVIGVGELNPGRTLCSTYMEEMIGMENMEGALHSDTLKNISQNAGAMLSKIF